MPVTISLPEDVERQLRSELPDLDERAREALLIALYRDRKLSIGRLGRILGIGAIAADAWLADRGVTLNYTSDDLRADREALGELRRTIPPTAGRP